MTKKEKADRKADARKALKKLCPPGTTVYTICTHVSRSGMSRNIDLYVIKENKPVYISGYVAFALDMRRAKNGEVTVGGCGMDMGYHLVNCLSYALHGYDPKGDGALPENEGRPFTPRRGHYRAGYSLNHAWL